MKKLRVLASAFTCCPPSRPGFSGGEDTLGWSLLKEIARHHEVWAITQAEDQASIEEELRENPMPDLHFCYFGLPRFLAPLLRIQGGHQLYYHLWQVLSYFTARRLHKSIRFDLFHHLTYGNDWMASYIGALLPVPYVRGPGGGAHRTPKGFQGEYPVTGRFWEVVRVFGQWLYRLDPFFIIGQRRARAILVCTRESISKLPAKWTEKIHLFPVSGVSSDDFGRGPVGNFTGDRFRVLSAGSLIRIKGIGLAIKAFKLFSERYPATSFDIIGSGPEEPRLRSIVEDLQLAEKVHFQEAIPRDDLLSEMYSHDVFLFPSLRDGGGTVVIESMAVGTPVVCLDAGGPGTHVTEECGVKITPVSPNQSALELSGALERLYLNEEMRFRMGEAGRARAAQLYRWDKLGDRLMAIYEIAVQPKNGR